MPVNFLAISRKGRGLLLALSLAIASTGCATILRSPLQRLTIESVPAGAKVWVDGTLHGTTPLQVTVNRRKIHTVKLTAPGHQDLLLHTDTQLNGYYVLANAVFGVVGLFIDGITGAWYDAGPAPLRAILSPVGQDCAKGECDYVARGSTDQ